MDEKNTIRVRTHGPDTQAVQSAVEGVVPADDGTIEFMGQRFRMAHHVSLMPLLKFAHVSRKGVDSADMEGLAVMYEMIRDCIDTEPNVRLERDARTGAEVKVFGESEWDRFERVAVESKASDRDLLDVVTRAIAAITARPTSLPSASSIGSPATSGTSRESSTSQVTPGGLDDLVPVGSLLDR
jgi:hypothetical protein